MSEESEREEQPILPECSTNVTERKRIDKTLRESGALYRAVVEDQTELICRYLPDGTITFVNEAYCLYFGKKREELIGRRFMPLLPEDREKVRRQMASATPENPTVTYDQRVVLSNGEVRWQQWSDRGIFDEQCRVVEFQSVGRDVTERKKAEEFLRESESRYRTLFDNASDAIFIHDMGRHFLEVNQAACERLGYTREEFLKMTPADIQAPRYADTVAKRIEELRQVGHAFFETAHMRRDGTAIPIELSSRIIDYRGKPAVLSIARDITERKRMEDELKRYSEHLEQLVVERTGKVAESERRLRELADLLPQIVFETDEKGNLTFGNRAGLSITGYAQEDLDNGLNALQLFVPEDRGRAQDRMRRVLGGEKSTGTEYRVQRKDGSTFPVIIHTSAILRQERPVGLRGIAIDITERKRMEEELRAAKERLDYVIGSNPAVIFTGKPHSDYTDFDNTYMSSNVTTLLGYEPREFIDDPEFWSKHVHPDDARLIRAAMPRLFRDGYLGLDYRFQHKDGTYRWIREEAKVVHDEAGIPAEIVGYWTDVSERKHLEEALLKSQRLATIGELAAMVGHDLRNPLTGIAGAAYYLKTRQGARLSEKGKEMLQLIQHDIERSDRIINDLLEYSKELHLQLVQTDVKSITRDALAFVKIPRRIRVINSTKKQPPLKLDAEKMRRVLVNLITNAIDAMPKGGTLSIASRKSGDNVVMTVRDTGEGMTEGILGKIWGPLFTTKARGIGLGLPITRRLVEAHGGSITVKSKAGKGAVFTVTIPMKPRRERGET